MTPTPSPALPSLGLDAMIERIGGGVAQLKLADGQRLQWPARLLPAALAEGDSVTLTALSDTARGQLARALANELLDAGPLPPTP